MAKDWGSILVGTRLEKVVFDEFVVSWSKLITQGLRKRDGFSIVRGRVAHRAANDLVRQFMQSEADTLFLLDSDASIGSDFLEEFRTYELGWDYDILQAFYTRRGWPPEAIWFKENSLGDLVQCIVVDPDNIDDVALIGTHCVLIRRKVFETLLANNPEIEADLFDWFFYPRHAIVSEDSAFAIEAREAGFKLGATTHMKAGHIGVVTTGWQTYQDYLKYSGILERVEQLQDNITLVADFLGEEKEVVEAKAMRGSENVSKTWNSLQPDTPEEVKSFYGMEDNGYFYDLISWNSNPLYWQLVEPLNLVANKTVLVIGAGIGGEILRLINHNNKIDVLELPGALREFITERFENNSEVVMIQSDLSGTLQKNLQRYDLVVAIDVLEHIHPEEITAALGSILAVLKPDGQLLAHNNFTQQDIYPMHYDHSEHFELWSKEHFRSEGEILWQKNR